MKKQVRAHLMGKNEMNNARHKTEKMKPKESVIKPTTIKKSHRCGNCGIVGHTKLQCTEPATIIEKSHSIVSINNMAKLFK